MTNTVFKLPDNPTLTDLLIWYDWLDEQGKNTDFLRFVSIVGGHPRKQFGDSWGDEHLQGYAWHNEESTKYLKHEKPTCWVIFDGTWNRLTNYQERSTPGLYKTYKTIPDAWNALMEACQGQ